MPADESERQSRFLPELTRHESLVTRVLVRRVLSRYAEIAPADWRFISNDEGKPAFSPGVLDADSLRFNLSNTPGLVICGVTRSGDLGVDVEDDRREARVLELASRNFAQPEFEDVRAVAEAGRRARFFRYWTLKEALVKATGRGLSVPLDEFWFELPGPGGEVGVSFGPGFEAAAGAGSARGWKFWQRYVTAHHVAAIARHSREDRISKLEVSVRIFRVEELAGGLAAAEVAEVAEVTQGG